MEELLPTPAAARVFGVSPRSLVRWMSQGLITPDRVTTSGHCRWSVADLDRRFEALTTRSTDDG